MNKPYRTGRIILCFIGGGGTEDLSAMAIQSPQAERMFMHRKFNPPRIEKKWRLK